MRNVRPLSAREFRKLFGRSVVRSGVNRSIGHSISSRVANSVRRDAHAVIPAMKTACTASTR